MLRNDLACVVCGIVHTGTTIMLKMFLQHPQILGPAEGHILRAQTPRHLRNMEQRKNRTFKGLWKLSKEDFLTVTDHEDFNSFFHDLRMRSPVIKDKTARLIDKTPSYVYKLDQCLDKTEDVPFIVMKKDPRNYCYSLSQRRVPWDKIIRLYKHSYETMLSKCLKQYPGRVLVVQWEKLVMNPEKTMRKVCAHVGIPYDENAYTKEFFEKKIKKGRLCSYKKMKPSRLKNVKTAFAKSHFINLEEKCQK